MNRRITVALLALGAGALGLASLQETAQSADAPKVQAVAEQNVDGQGLIRVHEQGTPTVRAQQEGTWQVGLTGRPSVQVVAPAGSPLAVDEVDTPETHPFQRELDGGGTFVVPLGRLLVIEFVSANCGGDDADAAIITTDVGTGPVSHFLQGQAAAPAGQVSGAKLAQEVRIYAAPGTTVSAGIACGGTLSLSGRLEGSFTVPPLPVSGSERP